MLQVLRRWSELLPNVALAPDDLRGQRSQRNRRAIASTVAAVGARGTLLLVSLISLPLSVGYLGTERYGVFVTLSSVTAMFVFADLGLGNGLLNLVSDANGRNDRGSAARSISSAFFMLSGIAFVLTLAFVAVYPVIDWADLLDLSTPTAASEVGPTAAALFGLFVVALPLGIIERTRMAYQEGFINSAAAAAGTVLGLIGLLGAILAHASLPVLVLAVSGPPVIALLVNGGCLFRHDRPWLRPRLQLADRATGMKLARIGILFLVLQLAVAVAYQSDVVVAAKIIGPSAATTYAVTLRVFLLVPSLVGLGVMALWPAYTEALARGDAQWIRRTLRWSVGLAASASSVSSAVLVFIGPWVIHLLTAGEVDAPPALLFGAAVWGVIYASFNAVTMLMNAASIIKFQVIVASAMALTSIASSILFANLFGLAGIVWGTVLAYVVCAAAPVLVYLPRMFRQLGLTASLAEK